MPGFCLEALYVRACFGLRAASIAAFAARRFAVFFERDFFLLISTAALFAIAEL